MRSRVVFIAALAALVAGCASNGSEPPEAPKTAQAREERQCVTGSRICRKAPAPGDNVDTIAPEAFKIPAGGMPPSR